MFTGELFAGLQDTAFTKFNELSGQKVPDHKYSKKIGATSLLLTSDEDEYRKGSGTVSNRNFYVKLPGRAPITILSSATISNSKDKRPLYIWGKRSPRTSFGIYLPNKQAKESIVRPMIDFDLPAIDRHEIPDMHADIAGKSSLLLDTRLEESKDVETTDLYRIKAIGDLIMSRFEIIDNLAGGGSAQEALEQMGYPKERSQNVL